MTLEQTHDMELVKRIITDKSVYGFVSDDGAPPASEYVAIDHPCLVYLLVKNGGESVGVFGLFPENSVTVEVHTNLLPEARGPQALEVASHLVRWVWDNTRCMRLTTKVPEFNRLALKFAKAAGMEEYGRNPSSYLKHGKLHDQILLGMTRPEVM